MNLSTIAMLLIAWQLLSKSNAPKQNKSPLESLSSFMSDDTKNIMDSITKLSDKDASQEDKTGAIFQMMTNPAVMDMASKLFNKQETDKKQDENDEGYKFETPSATSREFFRPIDNIADAEVKHKLYWFYDDWYVK